MRECTKMKSADYRGGPQEMASLETNLWCLPGVTISTLQRFQRDMLAHRPRYPSWGRRCPKGLKEYLVLISELNPHYFKMKRGCVVWDAWLLEILEKYSLIAVLPEQEAAVCICREPRLLVLDIHPPGCEPGTPRGDRSQLERLRIRGMRFTPSWVLIRTQT